MNKKEILKSMGFSEEYLSALDEFNNSGIDKFVVNSSFIPNNFKCITKDTSELHIDSTIINSSIFLLTKQ